MVGLPSAAEMIARLELKPHPEGGHFRETFRDARGCKRAPGFHRDLFPAGARRALALAPHDVVEVWHYYAGSALALEIADGDARRSVRLGPDLAAGEMPQAMVPPHAWQSAMSCGDWTLVGCTVAPGFDFAAFELAPKGWKPPQLSS